MSATTVTRRFLFLSLCTAAAAGCRTTGGANGGSGGGGTVKDLPGFLLPQEVTQYKGRTETELAEWFANGTAPEAIPSGYGTGIHIIPPSSQAKVPESLRVVTKTLWKGKWFNAAGGVMRDDTLGPDIGVRAILSIETLGDALRRHNFSTDGAALVDDKPSLITDYAATEYSGLLSGLVQSTKGWVDEFRVVTGGAKPILLGRSTYNGKFWGYVVLQLDPSTGTNAVAIPANPTREDIKKMTVDQWEALFKRGKADASLIPTSDHPGVTLKGAGFPLIFQTATFLNGAANQIWNGKNFTTEDGKTTLKNQFVQGAGGIQLLDANVVMDKSRYDDQDVILLDYKAAGVPGVEAVRDEVRLVGETIENGQRRRLYLGPTYLNAEDLGIAGMFVKRFERVPFLWFSLEFTDTP